ncbi:MAG: TadE/TadG family type IV pilus assembly protein [Parvularcula sp.]
MLTVFRSFRSNQQGVGAIEFAFCFPLLLAVYFLGYTYWEGHRANQNFASAATTAVDLVSRSQRMTGTEMDRVFTVTKALAGPAGQSDSFTVIVASISNPISGDTSNSDIEIDWVEWNQSSGDIPLTDENLNTLDLPIIAPGDSVIFVALDAPYWLRFVPSALSNIDLSQRAVRRPRFVTKVPLDLNA